MVKPLMKAEMDLIIKGGIQRESTSYEESLKELSVRLTQSEGFGVLVDLNYAAPLCRRVVFQIF